MNYISKKNRILTAVLMVLLVLFLQIVQGNTMVKTTVFDIHGNNILKCFGGQRIAQISDLHNALFGENNSTLIPILQKEKPNIILLTGDPVDSDHTDINVAISFVEQVVKIVPCYYVTGNHEAQMSGLKKRLRTAA